ncbi:MAG: membrane protein insertion efficiency factor YidD [Parachlamydiales bacterium]|nr:membrane protein insertion efficiency factor YidD [Parachlamydiales bacterium]
MKWKLALLSVSLSLILNADPFGKDSDLVSKVPTIQIQKSPTGIARVGESMIQFYQNHITQIDQYRSHYRPSSAQYTKEAIHRYGFFFGVAMGCDRLMRENKDPWVYSTLEENGVEFKSDPIK